VYQLDIKVLRVSQEFDLKQTKCFSQALHTSRWHSAAPHCREPLTIAMHIPSLALPVEVTTMLPALQN